MTLWVCPVNTPLVSVLVTVYNRERYLAASLDSVLAQTMRDFEVIIVDDVSTDGSVEIARNYAARESRIRFFLNERNLGDYPNRRRAAEQAHGRYVKYVDSDDILYPHSLAIMVEAMKEHPDAALALSHSRPEDERPYPWQLTPVEAYRKQFLGRGCMSAGPSGAIVLREAFEAVGGFGNWGVLNDIDLSFGWRRDGQWCYCRRDWFGGAGMSSRNSPGTMRRWCIWKKASRFTRSGCRRGNVRCRNPNARRH